MAVGPLACWGADDETRSEARDSAREPADSDRAPSDVTVHLDDAFADAERNTQALPASAAWFTSSGSGSLVATLGELRQVVSSSRTFLAYFTGDQGTQVTLDADASLGLDFDFRFTGFDSGATATDLNFRVALLRSVANPAAVVGPGFVPAGSPNTNARLSGDFSSNAPTSHAVTLYSGYGAFTRTDAVTAPTPIRFYARNGSSDTLLGTTSGAVFTQIPVGTPMPSLAMAVDTAYHGRLLVERTGTGAVLTYTVTRVSDGAVMMSHSVVEPAASMTVFDTVAFYLLKSSASANYDFILTRVKVSLTTSGPVTYPLNLSVSGSGSVAADPSPGPYAPGTVVTLTASPDPDNLFTGWSGDLTGTTNPATITMDGPRSVTANFAPVVTSYPLSLSVDGSGSLTADPSPGPYAPGTVVTLTATADAGHQFTGWSGDLAGSTNPATITMDAAKSVTAHFESLVANYTLTLNNSGQGSVVRLGYATPVSSYPAGTALWLTAVPAAGWTFAGWSGDLAGTTNPQLLTMSANRVVTASFTADSTPDFGLYGWATTNGGTTGGAGGLEVVVSTIADLRTYAYDLPAPYIIKIAGTISGNEVVRVRSNKSILGIGNDARLLGVGLQVGWNSEFGQIQNVIIRNITFEKAVAPIDGVALAYGAHNIWVDHCNFFSDREHGVDFYDGLLDVNHGADFITVSWSRFYEHYKTSLVGNSDGTGGEDAGHLTVTYHHNSFINSGGRNPSVRFGLVHLFNNYYRDLDDYGVASRMGAEVVIENNWFENVNRPIRADTSLSPIAGFVRGEATNSYVNCTANSILTRPATWVPPYAYDLDPVADVPGVVGPWSGVGIVTFPAGPSADVQQHSDERRESTDTLREPPPIP